MGSDKTIGIGIGIVGAGCARTTQFPGFLNCEGARVAITSRDGENAEKRLGPAVPNLRDQ